MSLKRADNNLGAIAIYPGSFDPPTLGHVSLVSRGLAIFDKLIVAVAINPLKSTLFSVNERVELLKASLDHFPPKRMEIQSYEGLTVEFAHLMGASAILRGLRGTPDFDYEFQMAIMNKHLKKDIHSVFLMADQEWFFISSSTVKEAASFGADISHMVPRPVAEKLALKFKKNEPEK
ncbi:MAG: pantetheine-phosphate adenylyltransferase [Deltaproteobacteria bacterium]|nr:pantetheine-phosphate adenylyltransferase [Deltaproteobacteria bacterium]